MTKKNLDELYKDTDLTPHMEDYIEAIIILSSKNKVVRVKDIAKELNIKMPSVTAALNKLKDLKLIDYEKYGYIDLTEKGKEIAELVYNRHSCITEFFEKVLQLDPKLAEEEACKVEHHINPGTCKNIHKLLNFYIKEDDEEKDWVLRLKKYLK